MKAQVVQRKNAQAQKTEFDEEFDQIRKIELTYERDNKKKEIEEIIIAFDEEIKEMQKEKYRLESDLKNAEMKLILFFEELILLRSMEGKDIQLTKQDVLGTHVAVKLLPEGAQDYLGAMDGATPRTPLYPPGKDSEKSLKDMNEVEMRAWIVEQF